MASNAWSSAAKALAKSGVNVRAADAMRRVKLVVTITGRRRQSVRMWLGRMLITLAARVIGCGIEYQRRDEENDA